MASGSDRDNERSFFRPITPHFFKIILDDTIRDGKLIIPRKFLREYGNNLPNKVVLKVPSGATWQIELMKCDGEICLQKGWQEFVEYYSIACGHLLVFEYEKTCHSFYVLIFDKSASEIDYPFSFTNGDNELKDPEIGKTEEESPLPFLHISKKVKLENSEEQSEVFAEKKCHESKSSENQKENVVPPKIQSLTAKGKASALRRAKTKFKSRNPFFMVAMQPSYVRGRSKITISATFARKYFEKMQGKVILEDGNGRVWSARHVRRGKKASIDNGWRKFSEDNELEVGDVCVFELVNAAKTKLKVTIFRHNKDTDRKTPVGDVGYVTKGMNVCKFEPITYKN
ncbi:B3 domain-containing transcription factor VRN1-like [Jatropha curcas]|uniref:B3 domain-containing transcription factor VRN1-like n=1 Tax=Jatropha curcas TaxID=180498 RepID=UPI00189390A8|nr:B3 domain-containing transcription factor VRN1-like [Jatropha curcas]